MSIDLSKPECPVCGCMWVNGDGQCSRCAERKNAPSWWDIAVVTPRQLVLVGIVWTALDFIKITVRHLL